LLEANLEDRLEEESGGGERGGGMAAAEGLTMAGSAGATHAEEGLPSTDGIRHSAYSVLSSL
jgi:hypothetical protein